jgi:hypothetical protein
LALPFPCSISSGAEGNTGFIERVAIPAEALRIGSVPQTVANVGDSSVTERDQVRHGAAAGAEVVDQHRMRITAGVLVIEQNDRNLQLAEERSVEGSDAGRRHHNFVDAPLFKRVHDLDLALRIGVAVCEENRVVMGDGLLFDAAHELGHKRIRDAGHPNSDRARTPGGQAPRDGAGAESVFGDDPADPPGGLPETVECETRARRAISLIDARLLGIIEEASTLRAMRNS